MKEGTAEKHQSCRLIVTSKRGVETLVPWKTSIFIGMSTQSDISVSALAKLSQAYLLHELAHDHIFVVSSSVAQEKNIKLKLIGAMSTGVQGDERKKTTNTSLNAENTIQR